MSSVGFTSNGERYFLAPSLVAFRDSIDNAFPYRDRASDGWIGDSAHATRQSDHNPCWVCTGYLHGIVRAIDVDIDGGDPNRDLRTEVINSAIGHPAVWYVISNRKIYSRTYNWEARDYDGLNPHEHHVHISINHDLESAKDTTLVLKPLPKDTEMATLDRDDLTNIEKIVQKYSAFNAENLRQRIDDIANAAARAVDTSLADDISGVNSAIDALKADLQLEQSK